MNAPMAKPSPSMEATIKSAAELLASGADPDKVARVLYHLAYMDDALAMAQVGIVDAAMRRAL